ncbi:adenine phosphoribosyltransferase 1 [Jimgerdemannia flammicorona]|uniref:adenine phosphoribosyltransferase n=1 Tax=Jimgerdemannia flammicorona TaxID=994334 RepID=A0A433DL37_9FUNG|nr:adenine phosphoribosyltransferase 1 [Jimgerdemannia flammicorona]
MGKTNTTPCCGSDLGAHQEPSRHPRRLPQEGLHPAPILLVAYAFVRLYRSAVVRRAVFLPRHCRPLQGIVFKDIFPVFQDSTAVEALITNFVYHVSSTHTEKVDVVVGLDARGFLFGPLIALRLGAAFVPVRKQGKLPGETVSTVYAKEYGEDIFELQKSAIKAGQRAIIVDDLIATGGSAKAAGELVRKAGGKTVEYLFVMELSFLNGAAKLDAPSYSLVKLDD